MKRKELKGNFRFVNGRCTSVGGAEEPGPGYIVESHHAGLGLGAVLTVVLARELLLPAPQFSDRGTQPRFQQSIPS